ncbi:MAG: hypothetical protein KDD69_17650 [Bdellovibrionales bacterium]|nr:hypothetical protein [Bdellovibrionales bacterium]
MSKTEKKKLQKRKQKAEDYRLRRQRDRERREAARVTPEEEMVRHAVATSSVRQMLSRYRKEQKVGVEVLMDRLIEDLDECVTALRSDEAAREMVVCEAGLAATAGRVAYSEKECKDRLAAFAGRLIAAREKLLPASRKTWKALLRDLLKLYKHVGDIHEAFHVYEDNGSAATFDLQQVAHERVHGVLWDTERLLYHPYIWR